MGQVAPESSGDSIRVTGKVKKKKSK